jgi:hypothetical protein
LKKKKEKENAASILPAGRYVEIQLRKSSFQKYQKVIIVKKKKKVEETREKENGVIISGFISSLSQVALVLDADACSVWKRDVGLGGS